MSIKFEPSKLAKKFANKKKISQALSKGDLSIKRASFGFVDQIDILNKKDVIDVALKAVKQYKQRIKREVKDGAIKREAVAEIAADPKLLVQRVQNEVILQISEHVKEAYAGERYVWLPSDADEPDPEHQLNYGKTFVIGEGEQPGERIGCRCGMEILVKGSVLELTNNTDEE